MWISGVLLTMITIIIVVIVLTNNNNNNIYNNNKVSNNANSGFLTLMLEQDDGSYQESTSNTWPEDGYAFNSNLSRCENGGELSWDREANIVKLISNKSDRCYVYFDKYNVVKITNVSTSKTYNSVTVSVETTPGDNNPSKYYFSIDGGKSYQESNTSSYTFSNLSDNTNYTIKVYVKDTAGYDSLESVVEVTTNAYVNPVVNSVTATNITTNSITVSVSATGGTNNVATYYYSINIGAYTSSSSNKYTFSGLNKGTTYTIKVYVKDTNGVDSSVYNISVTTIDYINPSIISISETEITTNSISITVYAQKGTNNISRYYYSIDNGSYTSSRSNSYTFSGLSKGKSYEIKVYVVDSIGEKSSVKSETFTTDDGMIEFYVDGKMFKAEDGHTWANATYYIPEFIHDRISWIKYNNGWVYYNGEIVDSHDRIIEGARYNTESYWNP